MRSTFVLMGTLLVGVLSTTCGTTARGPSRLEVPAGMGAPTGTPEVARTLAETALRCSEMGSWIGEGTIAGTIRGRRVNSRLRMASSRTEFRFDVLGDGERSAAVFVWAGVGATSERRGLLLLPGRRQAVQSQDDQALLDGILGIRLPARDLYEVLLGCHYPSGLGVGGGGRLFEDGLIQQSIGSGQIFMRHDAATDLRHYVALFYPGDALTWRWRVDYLDYRDGFPRTLLFLTHNSRTDFTLRIEQVQASSFPGRPALDTAVPLSYDAVPISTLDDVSPFQER